MRSNRPAGLALLGVVFIIAAACAGPTASPSGAADIDVTGEWMGECFGCAARRFTLVLSQAGTAATGTIKTEGAPNFGDAVKPILNGKVSGRKLGFQAKGDPGDLFDVDLTASPDGRVLSGTGQYRGSFGLRFTRVSR